MTPYTHIHADPYMETYHKLGLFISLKFLLCEMYKCDFEFYFSNNAAHDKTAQRSRKKWHPLITAARGRNWAENCLSSKAWNKYQYKTKLWKKYYI